MASKRLVDLQLRMRENLKTYDEVGEMADMIVSLTGYTKQIGEGAKQIAVESLSLAYLLVGLANSVHDGESFGDVLRAFKSIEKKLGRMSEPINALQRLRSDLNGLVQSVQEELREIEEEAE